jgi:cytochrome c553
LKRLRYQSLSRRDDARRQGDLHRFESRDPRSTFTAYVPVGSLAKGEALVTKGGAGRTLQCAPCHGPDLKGLGPLPSIAGRSPSYMFRQLYDFRHGARTGEWSPLMAQVVSNLEQQDMLAIVAYLAARSAGPQLKLETSGCGPNRCRVLPFSPARRVRAARVTPAWAAHPSQRLARGLHPKRGRGRGKDFPLAGSLLRLAL